VRIEILSVLEANGALTVTEIQEQVDITVEQSLLSHHLIKMKDKGLLLSEKRGMNVFYRLSDPTIMRIFDCLDGCSVF
jgi:DNA-binding transcriptional ArsR family regulator